MTNRLYTPVVPSKTIPIPDQNGQSVYPFLGQNGGAYICDWYKELPPPRL